ncbi:MAG: methyltransferase domain-containing protein [Planctomycetota bacterium]|jgi:2-polyprenyl-3-methyl-5-hydroxy-6-metoxy-1,4-benzoquinol methylase
MANVDPETGIWSLHIAKKRHQVDYVLAAAIATYYDIPEYAADVGCGLGHYCRYFNFHHWQIVGYEGTEGVMSLGVWHNIIQMDLTVPQTLITPYDFVLCLEVGEHIPQKHEQSFLDNLNKFVGKDLVMSWAVPGQYSASGHVNNQPNEYIIEQMWNRGLKYQKKMTRILRYYSNLKWFKNTIMVFKR